MKGALGVPAPKDAEYPHVPTPKELELSRQVVDLQEKDAIELKLMAQIQDLESQTHKLQVRIHDLSEQLQATKREQIQREQDAVEKERRLLKEKIHELELELAQEKNDKEAQKRWRVKFTEDIATNQESGETTMEPLDDALAKFAQSIALLPARTAPKAAQAGVLPFLVHLLRENFSDVVTGSALLALVHLAIYRRPQRRRRCSTSPVLTARTEAAIHVKEEIVKAGVAAPLAHILETVRNQRVLTEATRLCTALSIFVPNKRVLAAKNIVRLVIQLLVPGFISRVPSFPESTTDSRGLLDTERLEKVPIETAPELQQFALSALVNLSHDSEVIRSQIVNFRFIPIAVRYLRESPDVFVQAEAAKLLGNLAYNHVVNQSVILTSEGDAWLTKRLTTEWLAKSRDLIRACAVGVGNLAYTSVSQLSIGYGDAMTYLLQLLVDATDPLVVEAAAVALGGICHQSPLNKSRAAAQNGLQVLLYVIGRSNRYGNDEDALVAALECLCVLARPKPARQQVLELDRHLPLCQTCKKSKSPVLLTASAMALCVLIPTPLERHLLLTDSKESKMETNGIALSCLKRVRHTVYGKDGATTVPLWLEQAISRLAGYAAARSLSEGVPSEEEESNEFHERSYYSMESLSNIEPDELCPGFYIPV